MKMFACSIVLLLLAMLVGCSGKEQVYEGLYKGLGAAEQYRQTENPSYDPIKASEQQQPEYREYKREREESLVKNNPANTKDN